MNKTLKQRIATASEYFASLCPRVRVADVTTFRRDAFQVGAMFALDNQWISVEEDLPEFMQRILVACRLNDRISVFITRRVPHRPSPSDDSEWKWEFFNN